MGWNVKTLKRSNRVYRLPDALLARFDTTAKADAALQNLKLTGISCWSLYVVKTDEEKLDRMVNIWNQYQCMVTFNMSRSASYYESGTGRGMGFRDSCQDLLGFVHLIPARAREAHSGHRRHPVPGRQLPITSTSR